VNHAAVRTVELLTFEPQSARTTGLFAVLQLMADRANVRIRTTTQYQGGADWLLLWGPGHPTRFEPMAQQLAAGGHVIATDLAYWNRDRKVRVSFDAAHPQAWVMKTTQTAHRLAEDCPRIARVWNPDGHVLVCGIGAKAKVQYGDQVDQWERAQIRAATLRGQRVVYRPKREGPVPVGVERDWSSDIDSALQGAAALVTWHSNTAVDAIRLGVPVICRDGAAAAVCPSEWPAFGALQPLPPAVRDQFLANLAWFQWAPDEAVACLRWMREMLA